MEAPREPHSVSLKGRSINLLTKYSTTDSEKCYGELCKQEAFRQDLKY